MRVIITGGTGLIGTALAKSLVTDGHEVYVLSRNPQKHQVLNGVNIEGWDAKTGDSWSKLITDDTAIVNLAGAGLADGRWTEERKKEIVESRTNAGQAVVDAIGQATHRPKVVIQASAVGYYGPSDDSLITEAQPAGGDFSAAVCQQWEAAIQPVIDNGDVRVAIIRSGVVLSMEGGAFPRQLLPFKLFVGGPVGSGQQWYSWIHIEDEVRAIRYLIDKDDASGVFNLTAPNPVSNQEFSFTLARILRRPGVVPVPGFVLQLLFGEMASVLLDGQRVVPHKLQEHGFEFQYPEPDHALRNLLGKA